MGEIAVGRSADCVLYDLNAFSLLPRADPVTSLVMGSQRPWCGGSQVDRVWVRGIEVVRAGRPTRVDEEVVKQELINLQEEFYPAVGIPEGNSNGKIQVTSALTSPRPVCALFIFFVLPFLKRS